MPDLPWLSPCLDIHRPFDRKRMVLLVCPEGSPLPGYELALTSCHHQILPVNDGHTRPGMDGGAFGVPHFSRPKDHAVYVERPPRRPYRRHAPLNCCTGEEASAPGKKPKCNMSDPANPNVSNRSTPQWALMQKGLFWAPNEGMHPPLNTRWSSLTSSLMASWRHGRPPASAILTTNAWPY